MFDMCMRPVCTKGLISVEAAGIAIPEGPNTDPNKYKLVGQFLNSSTQQRPLRTFNPAS